MKRIVAIAAIVFGLASCAGLRQINQVVTDTPSVDTAAPIQPRGRFMVDAQCDSLHFTISDYPNGYHYILGVADQPPYGGSAIPGDYVVAIQRIYALRDGSTYISNQYDATVAVFDDIGTLAPVATELYHSAPCA